MMFKTVAVLALTSLIFLHTSSAQITANVVKRVLMIRSEGSNSFGTGFTLEVDRRQYLITAKHVVAGMKESGMIEFRQGGNNSWVSLPMNILRCSEPVDIAVLVPPKQLTPALPFEPKMNGVAYSQDVYFLGFPYGLFSNGHIINMDFPFPLVKKAIVSAITLEKGVTSFLLDGHNNPEFSGGPVVYLDVLKPTSIRDYKVMGVISGFQSEGTPVFKKVEIKPGVLPSQKGTGDQSIFYESGRKYRLEETDTMVQSNTGIIVGYSIDAAIELIKQNPLGPKIDDTF